MKMSLTNIKVYIEVTAGKLNYTTGLNSDKNATIGGPLDIQKISHNKNQPIMAKEQPKLIERRYGVNIRNSDTLHLQKSQFEFN